MLDHVLLTHLDAGAIFEVYRFAPGNEVDSGKIASAKSSSALVANGFGFFLRTPELLPPLPGVGAAWPARSVRLEGVARFPWAGGRHPCLDVLIETSNAIVGIESKRYEPFRSHGAPALSEAYWRPVWGDRMRGFERVRDGLQDGSLTFEHLDAAQLLKHGFGLRTAAARARKRPTLLYLFCEPPAWPDGRVVATASHARHRREIDLFATAVAGDEVDFVHGTWREVVAIWATADRDALRGHATAMLGHFAL